MTGEANAAREAVLARVRDALRPGFDPPVVPRRYRLEAASGIDLVALLSERLVDYRARVHRTDDTAVRETVRRALEARGAHRVVVPDETAAAWVDGDHFELTRDVPALGHAELDAIDAVVTGCALAIAETGTIVLDAGAGQGRRVLSLLPDCHVCLVRADQVVGDVPEALPRLDPRRPLTWISGPSATSDIELSRVEGVHGPRKLDVVIVG